MYNLTLGKFKKALERMNPNSILICTNALYIQPSFGSYEGFYKEIFFDFSEKPEDGKTVAEILDGIYLALKTFPITESTKVWLGSKEIGSCMAPVLVEQFNEQYVTLTILQK